jgi:hypothetical protein
MKSENVSPLPPGDSQSFVQEGTTWICILPGAISFNRKQARAALKNKDVWRESRHLKPLFEVVRDYACSLLLVRQGQHEHPLPERTPWIVILGDDLFGALGPDAFHRPSLDALIMAAVQVVLVACGLEQLLYNMAATHAARHRRNCILIETLPEQMEAWEARLKAVNSDLPIFYGLVPPEESPS